MLPPAKHSVNGCTSGADSGTDNVHVDGRSLSVDVFLHTNYSFGFLQVNIQLTMTSYFLT